MEFLKHPILGIGWGDFANVNSGNYPHNALLEVASELGLVGIVTFAAMLLVGALRTWRRRSTREVRVLAAVAAVALVGQQFSSDLTNRSFWIAFVPTLLFGSVVRDREPTRAMPEKVVRTAR
jgi:O-antigen ligase